MSGHSKWATIKRKKGAIDAKRGKIFNTLIKEIQVAARSGGGDLDANPRLRTAVAAAKANNMPNDNINKAIQRGTGELPGVHYEESSYEGFGPGGAAILIECMTDNKQRTVAEIRHLFSKYNGSLAENGAVSWMFDEKGVFTFDSNVIDEESLLDHVIESGAEDMKTEDSMFDVYCTPKDFHTVQEYFENKGIKFENAEMAKVPQNIHQVEQKDINSLMKLLDALEDLDDVQKVWANIEIDDESDV
ncbi:YebC/PmpR family DNA-binding transcriptional regulator [Candidatus Latescibacterota bacterium]